MAKLLAPLPGTHITAINRKIILMFDINPEKYLINIYLLFYLLLNK